MTVLIGGTLLSFDALLTIMRDPSLPLDDGPGEEGKSARSFFVRHSE